MNTKTKTRTKRPQPPPPAKKRPSRPRSAQSSALSDRLLHELQVHQVELEAQNQDLREAHRLLEESRNRYADLYDLAPVGYVTLNRKGLIQEINLPGAEMLGVERSRLIGLPFNLHVASSDKPSFREYLRRCQAESRPGTTELHLSRKDGTTLEVELRSVPVPNPGHKTPAYLTTITEITQRRALEESLREGEALFRTVFEQAGIGIALADNAGRLRQTNPALQKILGYSEAELVGRTLAEFTPPEDLPLDENLSAELAAGKRESYQIEQCYRRKDGQTIWGSLTITQVRNRQGKPSFTIGMVEDVTEYKRAEQLILHLNQDLQGRAAELSLANEELDSFSYSVSHDLRTPLTAITNFASVLLEDYGAQFPDDGQRFLNLIQENAVAMARLIQDLLTFSRMSRQPLNKETVATGQLVRQVLEKLRNVEPSREVEVVIGDLPPCQADPALLTQVWVNLLTNAFKFTSKCERTRVEIGALISPAARPPPAKSEGEMPVVYFVKDNGVGFDMEQAGKLFGVFHRLHSEEDYPGTGVGLAIVERIIRRHGGKVWAESVAGQGASFYFTLP